MRLANPATKAATHAAKGAALTLALCAAAGQGALGQLAITEVMSWASTTCHTNPVPRSSDFWELTNFSTNTVVNLEGYRFCDRDKPLTAAWILPAVSIGPGESVVFVRSGNLVITNAEAFREWWGPTQLPQNLQIVFYPSWFGFDDAGDSVRLWDNNAEPVDHVDFDQAREGVSFAYETNTGVFGIQSGLGDGGAWQAVCPKDIGSPGLAPCGLVPIQILEQPESQTVDAGMDVVLNVSASGRPAPTHYQWFFNGTAVDNADTAPGSIPPVVNFANYGLAWVPNPKPSDLVLTNVQPAQSGDYSVVLSAGSQWVTSVVARLMVNTNPLAPAVRAPPVAWRFPAANGSARTNSIVFTNQMAVFGVQYRGYPPPTVQWAWSPDGLAFNDIWGATERTLTITSVQPSDAGVYRVQLRNALGITNAYARLSLSPKPLLKISEAMSLVCDSQHNNWWELTNLGQEPVDLCGYRWDDAPGSIGSGPTIALSIIIEPRESIIFTEHETLDEFTLWWGADNLPAHLRCITYQANGFNDGGDQVTLWNPFATANDDYVDSVSFSGAASCASFWFDPDVCPISEVGVPSVLGQGGAFQAAQGSEVGSPGWTRWSAPAFTSINITPTGDLVSLRWSAQPGSTNRLQWASLLTSPTEWMEGGTYSFPVPACGAELPLQGERCRFYRLVQVTNAVTPCPGSAPGPEQN